MEYMLLRYRLPCFYAGCSDVSKSIHCSGTSLRHNVTVHSFIHLFVCLLVQTDHHLIRVKCIVWIDPDKTI